MVFDNGLFLITDAFKVGWHEFRLLAVGAE